MKIKITYDNIDIDWEKVSSIIEIAGLSSTDPETCKRAFLGSQITVFALDDKELIGVARALSDGIKQAAIYDVALLPDYQGLGVGRLLLDGIMSKLPGCNFILYSNPGKEGFYEKVGFRCLKTGMIKFNNPERAIEKGFIDNDKI